MKITKTLANPKESIKSKLSRKSLMLMVALIIVSMGGGFAFAYNVYKLSQGNTPQVANKSVIPTQISSTSTPAPVQSTPAQKQATQTTSGKTTSKNGLLSGTLNGVPYKNITQDQLDELEKNALEASKKKADAQKAAGEKQQERDLVQIKIGGAQTSLKYEKEYYNRLEDDRQNCLINALSQYPSWSTAYCNDLYNPQLADSTTKQNGYVDEILKLQKELLTLY